MATAKRETWFTGLSRNTVLLALASLFSDISTEMLFPILPVYLTQTLKAGGSVVGLIEGVATGLQNLIQGFSGSRVAQNEGIDGGGVGVRSPLR